jgi:hypothetical protein
MLLSEETGRNILTALGTLSAQLPAALGVAAGTGSLSVVPASNAGMATSTAQATLAGLIGGLTDTRSTAYDATSAALLPIVKELSYLIRAIALTPVVDSATMTRPNDTDPYVANDMVANSSTAATVVPMSFTASDVIDAPVIVYGIRIATSGTAPGTAGARFRVHLFRSDPSANTGIKAGDSATFSVNQAAGLIGTLTGTSRVYADGSSCRCVSDEGVPLICRPTTGARTVFALLQTLDAFTPSAQATYTLTIEAAQGRLAA